MREIEQMRKLKTKGALPMVILASGSANRKKGLELLDVPFTTILSNLDEKLIVESDPRKRVLTVARLKAREIAKKHEGIVIAADTFTVINNRQYEKPLDLEDARRMLREVSLQSGQSLTGICIINTYIGSERSELRMIDIEVSSLTEDVIERYIQTKPVTEWAAAYNPLDAESAQIFRPVRGYVNNLEYGIDTEVIREELEKASI